MPIVSVEALEGRTIDQKRALVKDITDAVTKNFNAPADAVLVIIHDVKAENLSKAGKLVADR